MHLDATHLCSKAVFGSACRRLYKNIGMNLLLFGNSLSGTVPTQLSNWGGDVCWLQESQAPARRTSGVVDNTNRWACPVEATGKCVAQGAGQAGFGQLACSYDQPPSPPLSPAPPAPPPPPIEPPPTAPPASAAMLVAIGGGVAGAVLVVGLVFLAYKCTWGKTRTQPDFRRAAKATSGNTELANGGSRMPGELPANSPPASLPASPPFSV